MGGLKTQWSALSVSDLVVTAQRAHWSVDFFIRGMPIHQAGEDCWVCWLLERTGIRVVWKELCVRAAAIEWPVVSRVACVHCVCICVWPRACNYYDVSPVFGACASLDRRTREWDAASAGPVASFVQHQCVQRDECVITRCVCVFVCARPKTGWERKIHLPDVLICGDHSTWFIFLHLPSALSNQHKQIKDTTTRLAKIL